MCNTITCRRKRTSRVRVSAPINKRPKYERGQKSRENGGGRDDCWVSSKQSSQAHGKVFCGDCGLWGRLHGSYVKNSVDHLLLFFIFHHDNLLGVLYCIIVTLLPYYLITSHHHLITSLPLAGEKGKPHKPLVKRAYEEGHNGEMGGGSDVGTARWKEKKSHTCQTRTHLFTRTYM